MKPFRTASMMTSSELAGLQMPGANLLDQMANEIARKLAADQDALIRRVAVQRIGHAITDEQLIPRLRWEIDRNKPEKLLLLDDEPLLMIWPPEHDLASDEMETANYMRWIVRYQEMP